MEKGEQKGKENVIIYCLDGVKRERKENGGPTICFSSILGRN